MEYNEKLEDYLANKQKINTLDGKEYELLNLFVEEIYTKRQESMEETRTPITSQQGDYESAQSQEDEIWFENITDNNMHCDLCQESSYKCFQCREETQPTLMFNIDPSDIESQTADYISFSEETIDSHWLLSSSGEKDNELKNELLEKNSLYQFEENEDYCFIC